MGLICPRTGAALRPVKVASVTVDFSEACGGAFLDSFEIQRFDDDVEFAGDVLAEMMDRHHDASIDMTARLRCPKHPDVVMMRRFYSPKRCVEIDECPECGGIWIDAGELATARREQPNQVARHAAARPLSMR